MSSHRLNSPPPVQRVAELANRLAITDPDARRVVSELFPEAHVICATPLELKLRTWAGIAAVVLGLILTAGWLGVMLWFAIKLVLGLFR